MARDKERSINPAQQQRKLEKAKALKKSRAELQTRRNEKLARRNPDRIQRQVDDLKALEAAGDIKPREKAILEELERDLKAVHRAREALGEKAPQFGDRPRPTGQQPRRQGDDSVLGKRHHDGKRTHFQPRHESSGSDTDESVRRIPMPEDTPPPIPREYRRDFRNAAQQHLDVNPLRGVPSEPVTAPPVKTTYESAPQIRDLKKEAVERFVPTVVRRKQEAAKGARGQLLEPEEMDRLEAEGYVRTNHDRSPPQEQPPQTATTQEDEDEAAARLAMEEERFQREIAMQEQAATEEQGPPQRAILPQNSSRTSDHGQKRKVQVEEVEDEGD